MEWKDVRRPKVDWSPLTVTAVHIGFSEYLDLTDILSFRGLYPDEYKSFLGDVKRVVEEARMRKGLVVSFAPKDHLQDTIDVLGTERTYFIPTLGNRAYIDYGSVTEPTSLSEWLKEIPGKSERMVIAGELNCKRYRPKEGGIVEGCLNGVEKYLTDAGWTFDERIAFPREDYNEIKKEISRCSLF